MTRHFTTEMLVLNLIRIFVPLAGCNCSDSTTVELTGNLITYLL
jgi:hypothetical protein